MSELMETLASQAGISPELAKNGVGAFLSYSKEHVGDDVIVDFQSALPNAHKLIESANQAKAEAGSDGLDGIVTGLAGRLLGGQAGDITKLFGVLTSLGFSAHQLEAFLPKIIEILHTLLPSDLLGKLGGLGLGLPEPKAAE